MTDTETAPFESLLCIETAIILLQLFVSHLDNSGCCIAGKFGGGKVWWIDSFRAFDKRKFGEWINQPIGY